MGAEHRLAFHAATGVDDWRMLYCGPIAHFATESVHAGVAFAIAIAALDELAEYPPLIDVRPSGVTVRLHDDILDFTDDGVADRARAVSAAAREHGLAPRPDLTQDAQIAIATRLPIDEVLPFWRAVLGYVDHVGDDLLDPHGRGPSVWFQQLDPEKPLRHAMHIDLAVPREIAGRRLDAAIAAGGRVAGDAAAVRYWTCADAAGNKVDLVAWPDLPMPEDEALRLGADGAGPGRPRARPAGATGGAERPSRRRRRARRARAGRGHVRGVPRGIRSRRLAGALLGADRLVRHRVARAQRRARRPARRAGRERIDCTSTCAPTAWPFGSPATSPSSSTPTSTSRGASLRSRRRSAPNPTRRRCRRCRWRSRRSPTTTCARSGASCSDTPSTAPRTSSTCRAVG